MSDMTGKVCLVTGASSGIGFETAKALADKGATVVTVSRSSGSGEQKTEAIRRQTNNRQVYFMPADLSSQAEIRRLAEEFQEKFERLDVLVNNAGLFVQERTTTVDGYELTFALNHLAYFLLTNLLLETVKQSAPARIVNVSSGAESGGEIHFDDLMLRQNYSGWKAYGQSKLANLLFHLRACQTFSKQRRDGQRPAPRLRGNRFRWGHDRGDERGDEPGSSARTVT